MFQNLQSARQSVIATKYMYAVKQHDAKIIAAHMKITTLKVTKHKDICISPS